MTDSRILALAEGADERRKTPGTPDDVASLMPEGECLSCGEDDLKCPKSQRPCGHHCNHSWTHDACDWCGTSWGENGEETPRGMD